MDSTNLLIKKKPLRNNKLYISLWISAMIRFQSCSQEEQREFLISLIQNFFLKPFEACVFDIKRFSSLLVVLDIVEFFIMKERGNTDTYISDTLFSIISGLLAFADERIPLDKNPQFKMAVKAKMYETILCGILQLAIIICNLIPHRDYEVIVYSLKSIILKCRGYMEKEKTSKNFNYSKIERASSTTLNYIAENNQRQRISEYLPNYGTAICNKDPLQNIIYDTVTKKVHLLIENCNRIITVYELKLKNGLYDSKQQYKEEISQVLYLLDKWGIVIILREGLKLIKGGEDLFFLADSNYSKVNT